MKRNNKHYRLLACSGSDTICPHCGRSHETDEVVSKCPNCGGNIVFQDAAIAGLPYIGSTLYFYNTSVTATITGYCFTETDALVEWMSDEPIYDNENNETDLTYGSFSVELLNSIVFLDKDDVPKEKYELRKLYCNVKTHLTEINSCEDLPNLENEAIAEDWETFYNLEEAKAALENEFKEISSDFCKDESGNGVYAYEISYLEIVKILEEIPEYDIYTQTGETVVNVMKPVKAE